MFKTKKTYGIVAVMLAISLLLCSGCAVIDKSLGIEPKETWHATVDEHFVDNKVDVVMQKYASKKTYTPKDFKEVGCVEIKIRTTEEQINDGMKLAISVILDKHSKENVLEACQKLIKRRDASFCGIREKLGRRRCSLLSKKLRNISRSSFTPYALVAIGKTSIKNTKK